MIGDNVSRYHTDGFGADLTADGTNPGLITIADTTDFAVGMSAILSSDVESGVECRIVEVASGTVLRLGKVWTKGSNVGDYSLIDTTAFLTADTARIDIPPQVVVEYM